MNIILSIHLIKTEMCSGVGMSGYVFFSEINGSASWSAYFYKEKPEFVPANKCFLKTGRDSSSQTSPLSQQPIQVKGN